MEPITYIMEFMKHRTLVKSKLVAIGTDLTIRGRRHDNSATGGLEKNLISSGKEKELLKSTHVSANDHHVEHFEHGVNDMHMGQLLECICDRMSRYEESGQPLTNEGCVDYVLESFINCSEELKNIITNTVSYTISLKGGLYNIESSEEDE